MSQEYDKKIRDLIHFHLNQLAESLTEHEMTTHGSMFATNCNLEFVVNETLELYQNPDPCHVSELYQRIKGMLKRVGYVPKGSRIMRGYEELRNYRRIRKLSLVWVSERLNCTVVEASALECGKLVRFEVVEAAEELLKGQHA